VFLSLSSELLGTSTGFPFGHYHYLSGLGYKIAGLVPFTIPLSWFYLGLVSYVIARAGLAGGKGEINWVRQLGAIALGAMLLTAYVVNFAFGAIITVTSLDSRFWFPTLLAVLLGVVPAIVLSAIAKPAVSNATDTIPPSLDKSALKTEIPPQPVGAVRK